MSKIIIVGTGSVTVPKQIELAERLLKGNHEVKLLSSKSSLFFLGAYFLRHPSKLFVYFRLLHLPLAEILGFFRNFVGSISHIEIARWADLILVAPATGNTIGKIASGVTDNFPLMVIRAFDVQKTVIIVPSMNPQMWSDPANQRNFSFLEKSPKYKFVGPVVGRVRSGEIGLGCMADIDMILGEISAILDQKNTTQIKKIA